MGNIAVMTLREYIRAGKSDIPTIAHAVQVSEGAVHKWVYGQRQPGLTAAMAVERFTGGEVTVHELTLPTPNVEQAAA